MGVVFLNILLLGSDERSIYLNRILKANGHSTSIHKTVDCALKNCLITTKFDVVILPVPNKYKKNDNKLYIKLGETYINENLIPKNSYCVYASPCDLDEYIGTKKSVNLLSDEEFTFNNAYITAEASLCIMLNNKYKTIKNSKCLISGFGRIGSCLYKLLHPICSDITSATANSETNFLLINKTKTISYKKADDTIGDYDLIINTAPENYYDLDDLNGLYYELASIPYGFNYEKYFADSNETDNQKKISSEKIIICSALPAKYYPFDAANIIYECMQRKIFK